MGWRFQNTTAPTDFIRSQMNFMEALATIMELWNTGYYLSSQLAKFLTFSRTLTF